MTWDYSKQSSASAILHAGSEFRQTAKQNAKPATKTGADFLAAFGDQGGVWFAQGKSFGECQMLMIQQLESQKAKLEAQLASNDLSRLRPANAGQRLVAACVVRVHGAERRAANKVAAAADAQSRANKRVRDFGVRLASSKH